MTKADALKTLQTLAQASIHPVLLSDELEACLEMAKAGPENWNLNRAAMHAWEMKAAKASDHHTTTVDRRRESADQIFQNCEAMARKFRNRLAGTV